MDSIVAAGVRFVSHALFGGGAALPHTRREVVEETPVNSGDEESQVIAETASNSSSFSFKTTPSSIEFEGGQTGRVWRRHEYLRSVLNWSTSGFVGRHQMNQLRTDSSSDLSRKDAALQHISIGVYNVQEVMEMVQNAADCAGFSVYAHRGARVHGNRCSIKFGCDHGRQRYGKSAVRDAKVLQKDLDTIVKDSCRKKRTIRENDGYKAAAKIQSRLKSTQCNFEFTIIAYQQSVTFNVDLSTDWHLSSHGNAVHNFTHSTHTWRGSRIIMSAEAKQYILSHCSLNSVQSICIQVQRLHNLDLTLSRVRYVISSSGQSAVQRQELLDGQSGAAMASIRQLLNTKNSKVIILAIDVSSGERSTVIASLSATGNAINFEVSSYNGGEGTGYVSRPIPNPDLDRVIDVHGISYFVHTQAWNYLDDTKLFATYPQVMQMDAQANVNRSTDGFNVVGVCGNYHNIVVLRSFIGDQRAPTFRWMFNVAFPYLLGKDVLLRVRIILVDGCTAVIGELQACCSPNGVFGRAKLLRCVFHLLIDAWDRQFGSGMGEIWFQEYKQYLFKLRSCETIEEFKLCADFVMRKAAGCNIETFPNISVIKFIMQRVHDAEDWVLYSHIHTCTRGCLATCRCESEHGHSRKAGVNARCSWVLAITRYEGIRGARKTRLMRWIRRQLDGSLARGPTNPDDTTLCLPQFVLLDAELLPWSLDTFEEQALLGRVQGLRCQYIESATAFSDKITFAVYFEGDDQQEEEIVADRARTEPKNSDSEEEKEEIEDDDLDSPSVKRPCASEKNEDENWTAEMQKELEEIVECPLKEEMKFVYKKVRRVAMRIDPKDPMKLILSCTCGYPNRIGCACRHIFCVLFTVLKSNRVELDSFHSVTNLCSCTSSPRTCSTCMQSPHYKKFEWGPNFDFLSLVNLDIASKVKYHAMLRPNFDAVSLFPTLHDSTFFPRIAASIMHTFARNNNVVNSRVIPKIGIPDANTGLLNDTSDRESSPPPPPTGHGVRRRHASVREEVPTLARLVSDLERIWGRTDRLKDSKSLAKRTEARKLMLSIMRGMEDQVSSLHPDLEPQRMQRYFSKRDYYVGNAARRQDE